MEPYGAQDRGKSMEIQERCPSLGLTETVKVCQSTELDYLDSHGLWMPLACVVQVLNWFRHVILFEANSCGSPDAMVQWRPCSPRGRLKFCVLGCFWYFLVSGFRYELQKRTVWPCPALHSWPLAKAQLWRKSWRIFAQSIRRCYLCARQRIELWGAYDIMWLHISHISRAELCKAYRAASHAARCSIEHIEHGPLIDEISACAMFAFVLDGFLSNDSATNAARSELPWVASELLG